MLSVVLQLLLAVNASRLTDSMNLGSLRSPNDLCNPTQDTPAFTGFRVYEALFLELPVRHYWYFIHCSNGRITDQQYYPMNRNGNFKFGEVLSLGENKLFIFARRKRYATRNIPMYRPNQLIGAVYRVHAKTDTAVPYSPLYSDNAASVRTWYRNLKSVVRYMPLFYTNDELESLDWEYKYEINPNEDYEYTPLDTKSFWFKRNNALNKAMKKLELDDKFVIWEYDSAKHQLESNVDWRKPLNNWHHSHKNKKQDSKERAKKAQIKKLHEYIDDEDLYNDMGFARRSNKKNRYVDEDEDEEYPNYDRAVDEAPPSNSSPNRRRLRMSENDDADSDDHERTAHLRHHRKINEDIAGKLGKGKHLLRSKHHDLDDLDDEDSKLFARIREPKKYKPVKTSYSKPKSKSKVKDGSEDFDADVDDHERLRPFKKWPIGKEHSVEPESIDMVDDHDRPMAWFNNYKDKLMNHEPQAPCDERVGKKAKDSSCKKQSLDYERPVRGKYFEDDEIIDAKPSRILRDPKPPLEPKKPKLAKAFKQAKLSEDVDEPEFELEPEPRKKQPKQSKVPKQSKQLKQPENAKPPKIPKYNPYYEDENFDLDTHFEPEYDTSSSPGKAPADVDGECGGCSDGDSDYFDDAYEMDRTAPSNKKSSFKNIFDSKGKTDRIGKTGEDIENKSKFFHRIADKSPSWRKPKPSDEGDWQEDLVEFF